MQSGGWITGSIVRVPQTLLAEFRRNRDNATQQQQTSSSGPTNEPRLLLCTLIQFPARDCRDNNIKATNEYNNDATENNNLDETNAEAEGTGDHVTRIPGGQPAASIADAASTILPSSKSMSSALGSWGGHKSGLGLRTSPTRLKNKTKTANVRGFFRSPGR
jgi:hypothetical protein